MTTSRFSLAITNERAEITRISEGIRRLAAQTGLDATTTFNLELIVDELVTNTVSYGYGDGAKGRIEVSLEVGRDAVLLVITDDGKAYDPLTAADPPLNEPLEIRPIGGLGIHFVRTVTDEIRYRRSRGLNTVSCVIARPERHFEQSDRDNV